MSLREISGEQLRSAIKDSGRSQADIAAACGLSQKHLSQMLGDKAGSFAVFDRVAAELGMVWVVVCWPAP